jgi:glycosyltransferase involved in cell wall biosynthesis
MRSQFAYNPLEPLRVGRPVDRYRHVRERCRGRRVLDLGAYDETEVDRPQHASWRWLHAEIAAVAREVLGVDASPKLKAAGAITTSCGTRIVYGTVETLDDLLHKFKPEMIIAGELIEHTPDALGWLSRLASAAPGVHLIATTPNATSIINLLLAFLGRENSHPDHLQVYSYRTLSTLAARVPLSEVTIRPYFYDPHLFSGRVPRWAAPLVAGVDGVFLRPIQWLFPLTSFGLIVEGTLGDPRDSQQSSEDPSPAGQWPERPVTDVSARDQSQAPATMDDPIDLSIVMPCLNEADTLATCIRKAWASLAESGLRGEVVVADNGSTDRSPEIVVKERARLVPVAAKGYGNALMGGIAAARGKWIIMGDADDSYDFSRLAPFIERLEAGFELVQGCRLRSGGGTLLPGAMPLLHRWWGNPMFSLMARYWFRAPINDVYCGLRAFTKDLYLRLDLRCTGMEFATEMIIKASLHGARIAEVPITLYPDGRRTHAPHLKTFRDGWRTLRFLLLYSPRWLFLLPGIALVLLGLVGYALAMPGVTFGRVGLDAHTLLFASVAILCGYQSILFAIFTKTFAINEGLTRPDPWVVAFYRLVNLERGLLVAGTMLTLGVLLLALAVNQWRLRDFGPLDYSQTMRIVVPGALLTALGFQTMLSSFFVSLLGMHRR